MTTIWSEDFSGAPAGVAVTTVNTAFDVISGGGSSTFDSTVIVTGRSCKVICGGTNRNLQHAHATIGKHFLRFYGEVVGALPSSNNYLAEVLSSGTIRAQLGLNTTGVFRLRNGVTAVATSTTSVAPGDLYRLEWKVDNGGTTQQLKIFVGANVNGATPDETITGTYNQGTWNQTVLGVVDSDTLTLYLDAIIADDTAYPGPANVAQTITVGKVNETEAAKAAPPVATITVGVGKAAEVEAVTAVPALSGFFVTVGRAHETETVKPFTFATTVSLPIGPATEIESGRRAFPTRPPRTQFTFTQDATIRAPRRGQPRISGGSGRPRAVGTAGKPVLV